MHFRKVPINLRFSELERMKLYKSNPRKAVKADYYSDRNNPQ